MERVYDFVYQGCLVMEAKQDKMSYNYSQYGKALQLVDVR